MMGKSILVFLVIIISINAYAQPCNPNALIHRTIEANDTDSSIDPEILEHQIFLNPDCNPNGKLLIHMVGSFDNPARSILFPTLAANHGYKAINLKYKNGTAVKTLCNDSSDPNCFLNFRQEVIFGVDSHPGLDINPPNGIVNRLEKLLIYLKDNHPSEDWGQYLTNTDEIQWSNIVVSGHSQGGGHAAFIAKLFEVDRALMFAAPSDNGDFFSEPANWISQNSVTPDTSYYAFGNLFDGVVSFDKQFENWEAMGLLSQIDSVNVDITDPEYNLTQILYTRHDTATISHAHSNMIIDEFTPDLGGQAKFTPVWKYMLGIDDDSSSTDDIKPKINLIKSYPNPTASTINITSEKNISKLEVYSLEGKSLITVYPNHKSHLLDLQAYKGVLLLKIHLQEINTVILEKILVF